MDILAPALLCSLKMERQQPVVRIADGGLDMADVIGSRGEHICTLLLTELCGRPSPLFKPTFLGEKYEGLDYIVELAGAGAMTPFFFAQIKTTRQGYTKANRQLRVQVSADDVRKLLSYPAPTYIIGIDEPAKHGFLIAPNPSKLTRIASLPTKYPLDCNVLQLLWDEVKDYWASSSATFALSRFAI